MASDPERFSFDAEWYDKVASVLKKFCLNYYPADNSVEIFDLKNRRLFLRRTKCEGVEAKDFYVGAIVTIFSRSIKITNFADKTTEEKVSKKITRSFAIIKPATINKTGEILVLITEQGFHISNLKMGRIDYQDASKLFNPEDGESRNLIECMTSGPLVALELLSKDGPSKQEDLVSALEKQALLSGIYLPSDDKEKFSVLFSDKSNKSKLQNSARLQNCTCCIIKPHAVQAGLIGPIIGEIQKSDFIITAMQQFSVDPINAEEFFEVYKGVLPDYSGMVSELQSGPCIAMEIISKNENIEVVTEFRKFCGPMDPEMAKQLRPSTLRAKYGKSKVQNAVHCSDLVEDGLLEGKGIMISFYVRIVKILVDKSEAATAKGTLDKEKTGEKSKAVLRAERRAKQESQRAAKQAMLTEKKKAPQTPVARVNEKCTVILNKEATEKRIVPKSESKDHLHEVNLFKHLYPNRKKISQLLNRDKYMNLHPAILRLGVQYAEKVIVGSNARCVALLAAVKQLIEDFERPAQADFTRGLEVSLQEAVNYLNFCRPTAVSMQNALKHLKWQMSILPPSVPDDEAKLKLAGAIDTYINEQILLARKAISDAIQRKISNGDVILTYGFSSLIYNILCDAYAAKKQFRVIIVDGRPWLEGKELLRRLVKNGIDCSYMLINALSFIMPQVNKVFLGAHAILANGAVMSRVGTAQIALMANAFNVPVLVACETHKSCERVQTDSIVYNELGDPDVLIKNTICNAKKSCLSNWRAKKSLNLLNITYDVTPADLVTAVVTELAILPCTSVPVILRIKPTEI
ncbi:hypothetical protein QAD02_002064 [Eretmocerus hayati]|uniref:Uncharacterized protein n=1 Tax=Eretmocerus hayati TaxID=131215 RepID=A0ACC2NI20_9HYME|nr:hypothetical protein QAD02_002064 [Eretmocerus hayati]